MHLGHLRQHGCPIGGDNPCGRFLDLGRDTLGERDFQLLGMAVEPVDETFPRHDRGRGDGIVALGLGALVELDFPAILHQRLLQDTGVGEFVGEGTGTRWHSGAEILDDAGMAPREQPVEIPDLGVELIVFFGCDDDPLKGGSGLSDHLGQFPDLFVRSDSLAVADPLIPEVFRQIGVDINPGHNKRPEQIPLAAFVDPEVGENCSGSSTSS